MWTVFDRDNPNTFPYVNQSVTVIWNDGGETDCIWTGVDWTMDSLPLVWKPNK